jgi:hypothetical protein
MAGSVIDRATMKDSGRSPSFERLYRDNLEHLGRIREIANAR